MSKVTKVMLTLLFSANAALYSQNTISKDTPKPIINEPPFDPQLMPTRTENEQYLAYSILAFGVVTLIILAILILKKDTELSEAFKYISIILIIVSTLFLVAAGYGNSQMTPVIGLLGTVAGLLLGKTKND